MASTVLWSRADTTINATNRYAFGANAGWMDWLGDTNHGVVIGPHVCSGYIFSPNLGWINVGNGSPANGVQYQNLSANDFGVNVDGGGHLRGFTFGANIGWVVFETTGAPQVDLASGKLSGFAFSPTCGWINLSNAVAFVQTGNKPTIIGPPQDTVVSLGDTTTFSVGAGGLPPLGYQWLFNGTNIPGAVLRDFSRASAQLADAGNYSVVVTNAFGSVTSAVATLTIGFPEIAIEQPAGTDLTNGASTVNFGAVLHGGISQLTFTIRNAGNGKLTGLAITIDGVSAADFSVITNAPALVPPGSNSTFIVTYAPLGNGTSVAALHLSSNDADESPFDIALVGRVAPPLPSAASGNIVTVAGGGFRGDGESATNALLAGPVDMAVGRDSTLYVYTEGNGDGRFHAVNPTNGTITTIATGSDDFGLAADHVRNRLYFGALDDDFAMQINLGDNSVGVFAGVGWSYPYPLDGSGYRGDGGPANQAWFSSPPVAVGLDHVGNVYIAEFNRVWRVDIANGIIHNIFGVADPCCLMLGDITAESGDGGLATNATGGVIRMAVDGAGDVFIMDNIWEDLDSNTVNSRIRRIDAATGIINTIAGTGTNYALSGPAIDSHLTNLQAIAVNEAGTKLYLGGITRIYQIDLLTGMLSPFAGDGTNDFKGDGGPALNAEFSWHGVHGIALPPGGGLLLSDHGNERVRYVVPDSVVLTNNPGITELHLPWINSLSGDFLVANNGNVTVVEARALTSICGDITIVSNALGATVDLSGLSTIGGCGTNAVMMTVDGNLMVTNGITIGTNVTLGGSATVIGSLINNGTISPGASPGHLSFQRNLTLNPSSRLRMEIAGYAANQFDSINVDGALTLGGNLSVSLLGNFPSTMTNGASFTLITSAGPITGAFANVASGGQLTTADGRAHFTVMYAGETSVRLTNLEILDANMDSDGDGVSDADELAAGTDPHNPASVFRITGIQRETNGVRISWSAVGGKSYVVQTNASFFGGSITNVFADFSAPIAVPGSGPSNTNLLDLQAPTNIAARYYRVRLAP